MNAKLARMNWEEPTLAASDLKGVASRTLVIIGDDDEVTLEHAIATYRGLPAPSLRWCPAPRTGSSRKSRCSATRSSSTPHDRPRAHHRTGPPRERSLRARSGRGGSTSEGRALADLDGGRLSASGFRRGTGAELETPAPRPERDRPAHYDGGAFDGNRGRSPVVAGIMGVWRAWTVAMISALSMPWR